MSYIIKKIFDFIYPRMEYFYISLNKMLVTETKIDDNFISIDWKDIEEISSSDKTISNLKNCIIQLNQRIAELEKNSPQIFFKNIVAISTISLIFNLIFFKIRN